MLNRQSERSIPIAFVFIVTGTNGFPFQQVSGFHCSSNEEIYFLQQVTVRATQSTCDFGK